MASPQVFPEHKYRIFEVLQKHGQYCRHDRVMVSTTLRLEESWCGIAVDGATDAARAAAAIVLLLPGLSVIIDAIKGKPQDFSTYDNYAIYR